MAITLDKSAMLEAASQAADEQHARLTSAQGALVAAILEQFVESLGLTMTGASHRVLRELLRRASSGEPIDEPPPDADDARREIREQIGSDLTAAHPALPVGADDGPRELPPATRDARAP